MLSNELNLPFSSEQPVLPVQLPGGHRFHAVLGDSVRSRLAVAVRVKRPFKATFEDFGRREDDPEIAALTSAIAKGKAFLVSGGTSSGKTTLLNLLVRYIPDTQRVIIAEDVPELDLPHRNRVEFLVSRLFTRQRLGWTSVVDNVVRERPDVVGLGELNIENTDPFLRLANSGHQSAFATLHANSPWLALRALRQNVQMAGLPAEAVIAQAVEVLDYIIQTRRVPGSWRREITDILRPADLPQVKAMMATILKEEAAA